MEPVTFSQQRLSARLCSTMTIEAPSAATMELSPAEQAPPGRLRSCKRRALAEREVCGSPDHYRLQLPPHKRLRRIQALSDLECSSRPRDSPTIPISVHQKHWLQDALVKAREIIHDKENAELVLQRVAGAVSVESLSLTVDLIEGESQARPRMSLNRKNKAEDLRSRFSSPASIDSGRRPSDSLHRKGKAEDLRSKYTSPAATDDERSNARSLPSLDGRRISTSTESLHRKGKSEDLRSEYSSPTPDGEECTSPGCLPSLEASSLPSPNYNIADGTPLTPTSLDFPGDKQQRYLYCVCQRTFDSALGEMVACDICHGWFHLRCVGQDQHDAMYFEDKLFYCPRCEAFAYQEIVSEEDGGAQW